MRVGALTKHATANTLMAYLVANCVATEYIKDSEVVKDGLPKQSPLFLTQKSN